MRRGADGATGAHGYTLVELLTALLVLSLFALMSYRGLSGVLDTRAHLARETEKWRALAAFFERFEHDVQLAMPRPVRTPHGSASAFIARDDTPQGAQLEFSRAGAGDAPRRVGYARNDRGEIELWLWPGLDTTETAPALRESVLKGVARLDIECMDERLAWISKWPAGDEGLALPRAVRLRIVLSGGEEIVRVYALRS